MHFKTYINNRKWIFIAIHIWKSIFHSYNCYMDTVSALSLAIMNTESALSLNTRTKCQHCQKIHRHIVSLVIVSMNTGSALPLNTWTRCQHCHWIHGHSVSIVTAYMVTVSAHWIHGYSVNIVSEYMDNVSAGGIDNVDIVSLQATTILTPHWLCTFVFFKCGHIAANYVNF